MNGITGRILVGLFCLISAGTVFGAQLQLHVSISNAVDGKSLPHPIDVEVASGADSNTRVLQLTDSGTLPFEPEHEGVWYLTPRVDGYWGETVVLVAPSPLERVELRLWPASTLHAELPPRPEVSGIRVRFQPSDTEDSNSALPASRSDCRIEARKVRCTVPAGRLDYSVRIPGYLPLYRWDQLIEPGKDIDLGRLTLQEGVALLGKVIARPGEPLPENAAVKVTLVPQIPRLEYSGDVRRAAIIGTSVTADERGRFIFEGVKPGGYLISASAADMISETREVTLIQGLEAELKEPLVVARPITFAVSVEPSTDPWGEPWLGELSLLDTRNLGKATIEDSPADKEGRWKRENLIPGDYLFKVHRAQGVWYSEIFSLSESTDLVVRIPWTRVQGVLKLGDDPVPGSIWFGGENGSIHVPATTNSKGLFRAILPAVEGHVWAEVDVASNDPLIRSTLHDVHFIGPDEDGIFRVEIVLPNNRLYGEVVNERGEPARSNATVFASMSASDASAFQVDVDDAGVFTFRGLPAGTFSVGAYGRDGTSESTDVVMDDESDKYVTLTLNDGNMLEGTVLSPDGPVVSALVHLYPEDRTGFGLLESARTGVDGTFRIRVVPNAGRMTMTVASPGYAYKFFELPVQQVEPMMVGVESYGGRLVASLPEDETGRQPYLFRDGAYVGLSAFVRAGIGARTGKDFAVENLEPGRYELCMATPREALAFVRGGRPREACSGGFLAPRGVLTLAAPKIDDSNGSEP